MGDWRGRCEAHRRRAELGVLRPSEAVPGAHARPDPISLSRRSVSGISRRSSTQAPRQRCDEPLCAGQRRTELTAAACAAFLQVLGSLRQQLLYPTWALGGGVSGDEGAGGESESGEGKKEEPWWNPNRWGMSSGAGTDSDAAGASVAAAAAGAAAGASASSDTGLTTLAAAGGASAHSAVGHSADPLPPVPTDAELVSALESVRLGHLVSRGGLDAEVRRRGPGCADISSEPSFLACAARCRALCSASKAGGMFRLSPRLRRRTDPLPTRSSTGRRSCLWESSSASLSRA